MDGGFSSYHNGGAAREQDFSRLAQTVGTSILKITSNGKILLFIFKSLILMIWITIDILQFLQCRKW